MAAMKLQTSAHRRVTPSQPTTPTTPGSQFGGGHPLAGFAKGSENFAQKLKI